jgi:tryptophan synthase beta subunit
VAAARRVAQDLGPSGVVLVTLSGRGDKDLETMMESEGDVAS